MFESVINDSIEIVHPCSFLQSKRESQEYAPKKRRRKKEEEDPTHNSGKKYLLLCSSWTTTSTAEEDIIIGIAGTTHTLTHTHTQVI